MLDTTLSSPSSGPAIPALYLAFVLSGAAGLIYESIWSRYLGLFVGHGAYAQIIVLVIFLGGMALGALLMGRRSASVREPLLWFAGVELAIGLLGFAFHAIYLEVTSVAYTTIFPALPGGTALIVVKWSIAALMILPQSVLLGASFPLMSAGVLRRVEASGTPGRVLAMLYFANSLGAAGGVLLAGFVLVAKVGLPGALTVAAIANVVVAAVTAAVALGIDEDEDAPPVSWKRKRPLAPATASGSAIVGTPAGAAMPGVLTVTSSALPTGTSADARDPALWRTLLLVSFGTAVASFIYEIAWIRMLSLVLGSATHSFELMLSAFILGLALGAFWVRTRADHFDDPVRALAIVQWAMGALAIATLPLYVASFQWTALLISALDATPEGYGAFNIARYAICLAIMLPATFCAGITLPLITRTLLMTARGGERDERAIGAVYGANTLGSIVGVVLAGLFLMPLLGMRTMLIAGALLDMAIGAALIVRRPRGERHLSDPLRIAAAASLVGIVLVVLQTRFDRGILVSGVFRYGSVGRVPAEELVFYRDGRTATVSGRINPAGNGRSIATNGKPDASLGGEWYDTTAGRSLIPLAGDAATQALLPLVSLAHAPDARTAAVIGLGSGMTTHILLGAPDLERVETIEIETEMIRGARRVFHPANRRVFDDPRSALVVDDAKSHFASAGRRYDLIISEPSNPWVSGVSGLFTREFYERVSGYLSDDGVFGQWVHLYELNDELLLTVIAAVHETFPSYEIFHVARGDMLIVASRRDTLPAADWSVVRLPGVAEDLAAFLPLTEEMLARTRAVGRTELAPLFELGRTANSDFHPRLDLGAERARYARESAEGFGGLGSERFDLAAALARRRTPISDATVTPIDGIDALEALAAGARLRAVLAADAAAGGAAADSAVPFSDTDTELGRFRHQLLMKSIRSGTPPTSWRHWVALALDVEAHLHGGTAGVADAAFFRQLYAYMRAHDAPPEAQAAIEFRHGLAIWDFELAAHASNILGAPEATALNWVPAAELRDGAVIALLAVGDVAGARSAYSIFTPRIAPERDDLRSWIVASHLRIAERQREAQRDAARSGSARPVRSSTPVPRGELSQLARRSAGSS